VNHYNVYRSETGGGPYILVAATLLNDNSSWKNTGLTSEVEYFYVMTAVIGEVESGYSNEVSAVTKDWELSLKPSLSYFPN
jgi:hypothetical protein